MKLDLVPGGQFIITGGPTVIHGCFCMWSLKRFCDKAGIQTILGMVERLTRDLSINDLVALILASTEYKYFKNGEPEKFQYTEDEVCEWIDGIGGILSPDIINLINHAFYIDTDGSKKPISNPTDLTWHELQRNSYGCGVLTKDFWDCTLTEIILTVRGDTDRKRFQRRCVEILYHACSMAEKKPGIMEVLPLPEDPTEEELKEMEKKHYEAKIEEYKKLFADLRAQGRLQ